MCDTLSLGNQYMKNSEIIDFLKTVPSPFSFTEINQSLQLDGKEQLMSATWNRLKNHRIIKVATVKKRGAFSTTYYELS